METSIIKNTCLAIVLLAGLSSCKKETLRPSGNKITEVRSTGTFKKIHTSGATPIFITYGTVNKVELRGSDNMIAKFKTETRNGELSVGYERASIEQDDLEVYITIPAIEAINLSGKADISILGNFSKEAKLDVRISGQGNINMIGTMEIISTEVKISGSGNANLEKLTSENADFNISGSGNIRSGVKSTLKARISGSGSIYYKGSPAVDSSVSGSGKLNKV